jgi:hypothetical protein
LIGPYIFHLLSFFFIIIFIESQDLPLNLHLLNWPTFLKFLEKIRKLRLRLLDPELLDSPHDSQLEKHHSLDSIWSSRVEINDIDLRDLQVIVNWELLAQV